jgi:(p)ppGpp synthase/HD superfamily hydrolase
MGRKGAEQMTNQVNHAIIFAATAHKGQSRKYNHLPYVTHCTDVLKILTDKSSTYVSEAMQIAAVLHDTVEDTDTSIGDIRVGFGHEVAVLVEELTDCYVNPDIGNREFRKGLERERLAKISPDAQTIKYADIISNLGDLPDDDDFKETFRREKHLLLQVMVEGDPALLELARNA